jgi:hypothetical protein
MRTIIDINSIKIIMGTTDTKIIVIVMDFTDMRASGYSRDHSHHGHQRIMKITVTKVFKDITVITDFWWCTLDGIHHNEKYPDPKN